MSKTNLAKQIETHKSKYYNPDCEINLSVEDTPMVCLVSNAEELESKCNLYESKYNLH